MRTLFKIVAPGILLTSGLLASASSPAHALTVLSGSLQTTLINTETEQGPGLSSGTFVNVNVDQTGTVDVGIFAVQNITDSGVQVGDLNTIAAGPGQVSLYWNGLWLINGDLGRSDGNYKFVATISSAGSISPPYTFPSLLQITSIDIHNFAVFPSTANGQASFPYIVGFSLAKAGLANVVIKTSTGGHVRTLAANFPGVGEQTGPNLLSWDGTNDAGQPVQLGIYSIVIDATDPSNGDKAIERTRTEAVQSLASQNVDPKTLFEQNTYVYPNPVRNSLAHFQTIAVRDGADLKLKIYTIAGDLVLDKDLGNVATGNIINYEWDAVNQAGKKVARGLYYYVVRENDSTGTLQTVKKLAVIQ